MGDFLFLAKNDKANNVSPKFHIISVIFEFLMELAIQGGEENKCNF